MQRQMIAAGILVLSAAVLLTFGLKYVRKPARGDKQKIRQFAAPGSLRRVYRLLLRAARLSPELPESSIIQPAVRPLMEKLLRLSRLMHTAPSLPAGDDGMPRVMNLARAAVDEGLFTSDACMELLAQWQGKTLMPSEIVTFPLCIGKAQCLRLENALIGMQRDAKERTEALRLAKRMVKSRPPVTLLEKSSLHSAGMTVLLNHLRDSDQHRLLSLLEPWLAGRETSAEELAAQALDRQTRLAEEIRKTEEVLTFILHTAWQECSEAADAAHHMLTSDPSGVYPRMDAPSRQQLRLEAEKLARLVHLPLEQVLQHALSLCREAPSGTTEAFVGYYFQHTAGKRLLLRTLPSKLSHAFARILLPKTSIKYLLLWGMGSLMGFLFLHSRQPVFMLPFFSLVVGCVGRYVLRRMAPRPLPGMNLAKIPEPIRTLVVIPAVLHDTHEAIRCVRHMKTIRHAFPEDNVDFLLLGDFQNSMTAVHMNDGTVIHAAASAIAALEDPRCLYMQRSRIWNHDRHTYCPRGGALGAVNMLCRLIVQGECPDVIAFSTVETAYFERRYSYVLVLPPACKPEPGMYEALLRVMTHPLCTRYATPEGWNGYAVLSPGNHALFDGVGLIRPDAYLEATDGLADETLDDASIWGALAGHIPITGARIQEAPVSDSLETHYEQALRRWQQARWQLPWVKTPNGLVRNPLKHHERFQLREQLRSTLIPAGQCLLLLWAVLVNQPLLLLIALLAPEISRIPRSLREIIALGCRLSLLPSRAAINLCAVVDAVRNKSRAASSLMVLEIWVQGISAAVLAALGLALPWMTLPALALGLSFACFPLAHRYETAPHISDGGLTDEHITALENLCTRTWRFFCEHVTEANHDLPPCALQAEPPLGPESATSPDAIASYLLSCICAKDLGLISADEAAKRIQRSVNTLRTLSMPFGLPCRRYALPTLTVLDPHVDAASAGLLLCALMVTAQALRTWLPEMTPAYATLSADVSAAVSAMKPAALYDHHAGLFYASLDENGQGTGHISCFADEALLLSIAACARRDIPSAHFSRLSHTYISLKGEDIPISVNGSASAYLLAGLFVPIAPERVMPFIHAMQRVAHDGMWGKSKCGYFSFDAALRYLCADFGLSECALTSTDTAPVYAPYAAALCLPFMPGKSGDALLQFQSAGACGIYGMYDAVDCSQGTALVKKYDAYHQGLLLMSAAHLLADSPIQRYFCAIPEIEACLPLLEQRDWVLRLPAIPSKAIIQQPQNQSAYTAGQLSFPPNAHLIGTADFRSIMDAWGNSSLYDGDIPLTRVDTSSHYGMQFYLIDEGRVYRIGDPALGGQVLFSAGEARIEQLCGSIKAELVCIADTIRRRALHVLTITNLSTRDQMIDAADFLLPDLGVPSNTLEIHRPAREHISLHARGRDRAVHHMLQTSSAPLSLSVCTDEIEFLGRGRTLSHPASLEEPAINLLNASAAPCLSFRAKLNLGGRGQVVLWYSTSLLDSDLPQQSELAGLTHLASLQHQAIDNAVHGAALPPGLLHHLLGQLIRSDGHMHLSMSGQGNLSILSELLIAMDLFLMHGMETLLSVSCPQEMADAVEQEIQGHPCEKMITISDFPPLSSVLLFNDTVPLAMQLERLKTKLSSPENIPAKPLPARLPEQTLMQRSSYGGFDPETNSYVIELKPGMSTPASWGNAHTSRHYREETDESGFLAPFHERIWIEMEDGTILTPWSQELPRNIRMEPGMTTWEAWSDKLDLRLCAACLPGHRCGLRILRVRNATAKSITLRLRVMARFDQASLHLVPDGVLAQSSPEKQNAFFAGEGWCIKRIHALDTPLQDTPPAGALDQADGNTVILETSLTLLPQSSGEASWLSGYARHARDVDTALSASAAMGKSALLRSIKMQWAGKLSRLTVSTPEDTLNLMMNSILPMQALSADGCDGLPALIYLSPADAKWKLLQNFRQEEHADRLVLFAAYTAAYVQITQDHSIYDAHLPAFDKTLFERCKDMTLSLPTDHRGLPTGDEAEYHSLLYATAAHLTNLQRPDAELAEFSRKLLNAADTYLWQDSFYGLPLRLDVQCLACAAYGANPRTRQAVRTAWMTLYDQQHGLIRHQEATDAAPLPGLPENGGMITKDAVLCIRALISTGHAEDAHELLRALNPLHHTDDSLRMEVFRCAPYRLHGGMCASPLEAGRAVAEGGDKAASMLYAIVLEDVLGLHREGSIIHIKPCVPADWTDYALTLREGTSTWHISVEKRVERLTIDGDETDDISFSVCDDGKVHQVRIPLR